MFWTHLATGCVFLKPIPILPAPILPPPYPPLDPPPRPPPLPEAPRSPRGSRSGSALGAARAAATDSASAARERRRNPPKLRPKLRPPKLRPPKLQSPQLRPDGACADRAARERHRIRERRCVGSPLPRRLPLEATRRAHAPQAHQSPEAVAFTHTPICPALCFSYPSFPICHTRIRCLGQACPPGRSALSQ